MKSYITYLIILITGLLLGFLGGITSFFNTIGIITITVVIATLTIPLIIYGLFKSKNLVFLGLTIILSITLSFGTIILTKTELDNYRQEIANSVIIKIEEHKKSRGKLPIDLKEINCHKKLKILEYHPDSSLQLYTLGYLMDGWNLKFYNSRTGIWMTTD